MDAVRRAPVRVARYLQSLDRGGSVSRSLGELARGEGRLSLHELSDEQLVSFQLPDPPMVASPVVCTNALCTVERGRVSLGVRLETEIDDPVMAITGCCTNDDRGAWLGMVTALNFGGDDGAGGPCCSPGKVGVFHGSKGSWWLRDNYRSVWKRGMTFRMVAEADMSASPRVAAWRWVASFGGQLKVQHVFDLTDDHPYVDSPTLMDSASVDAVDPDDATLSFSVSLVFE